MTRFFLKLIVFLLLVGTPYAYFQYQMMLDDPYYWKSTYRANHLIIGGSRAHKGISPSELQVALDLEGSVLNFAFTGIQSPYGQPYFKAVKRKIKRSSKKPGSFILSVSPVGIMDFADAEAPREDDFRFYDLLAMNLNPNLEYIFRHPRPGGSLLKKIVKQRHKRVSLTEVCRDGSATSFYIKGDLNRERRIRRQTMLKWELLQSDEREEVFEKMVDYLSKIGPVYLVRLPISPRMLKAEEDVYPGFNAKIDELAAGHENVYYFNFSRVRDRTKYDFYDGHHHLDGISAINFTRDLADSILSVE